MNALTLLFIEINDSFFYPGYTEEMASENPDWFTLEYSQFLENYGLGLERS